MSQSQSLPKRRKVQHRQFALALEYVRGLGISSQTERRERSGKGDWPSDIPREPARAYSKSGWVGLPHWPGTGEHGVPLTRTALGTLTWSSTGNPPTRGRPSPCPSLRQSSPMHKGCPECPHCRIKGVGLDPSVRVSPRTPSTGWPTVEGASPRTRCTVPHTPDPQVGGERAADLLATQLELAHAHDRYNPPPSGERPA